MQKKNNNHSLDAGVSCSLRQIEEKALSPLDLLPHNNLHEKLVELVLTGVPNGIPPEPASRLQEVKDALDREPVSELNVVVFGGGTGLSTIIGGDSRSETWISDPFSGLKALFPKTSAIVCVTDDGGSTGELLKDLPLIALGDIRHVLLSSIQVDKLQDQYGLTASAAMRCLEVLSSVFNYRFSDKPESCQQLLQDCGLTSQKSIPVVMQAMLENIIDNLFVDPRLQIVLERPHCLGNLILASSIYEQIPAYYDNTNLLTAPDIVRQNLHRGITALCVILGADEYAVMPCTHIPAELCVRYTNSVQVTGESKSGQARRGYPVESVYVNFCEEPEVSDKVLQLINNADIMIMAPGSLYSSLVPVFQVPGIADAVKKNEHALKILVSNLWVQAGETDLSLDEPDRKFQLSDLLKAYDLNIPGGTEGLFDTVLCLSLKDVPATVIQNYAIEGKSPIYLDRDKVQQQGVMPLECGIYSTSSLRENGVIRHDPKQFSLVVRTLWATFSYYLARKDKKQTQATAPDQSKKYLTSMQVPCLRSANIHDFLSSITIELPEESGKNRQGVRNVLQDVLWQHKDIPLSHLQFINGVQCVPTEDWKRNQNWDQVYFFYDPEDGFVKIRQDQFNSVAALEVAFLVALGQGILGNYIERKEIYEVDAKHSYLGKTYHIYLANTEERNCYFNEEDLTSYLSLSRMIQDPHNPLHFTRVVNGNEGFTPPGLLMGLLYAWYLDNRFAPHIEYKMAVLKIDHSDLIPEQIRMKSRREKLTVFFREVVFGH